MLRDSEIGREHCEVSYGYYYMGILEHNFEYTKLSGKICIPEKLKNVKLNWINKDTIYHVRNNLNNLVVSTWNL